MIVFVLLRLGSNINWVAEEEHPPHPDLVLISLCFGLSIATLVKCFGHISGAHINPAVTAAMVVTRRLSLAKAVFYLLAQRLGAVVGAAVLYGMGITSNSSSPSNSSSLCSPPDPKCSDEKGSAALAIGFSVCIGHLFAMSSTSDSQQSLPLFINPGLGGVIASALYEYLFCPDPELKRRSAEVLSKTGFPSTKYREVQSSFTADRDQLVNELPFTVMDVDRAERKEREMEWERGTSGGVLVCMTSEVHW
ncbi:unnamed protein product [Coregonus sp. 'balchen']|nr:unnamed protein product [Coregonus sp. 'balchen']